MAQATLKGDPPVMITLRRSGRARRVSLRVSGLDGRVTLSVPPGVSKSEALAFAEEKSEWIRIRLAEQTPQIVPQIGGSLPYEGRPHVIRAAPVRLAAAREGEILVPEAPAMVAPRLKAFLRIAAHDRLTAAANRYAAILGRQFEQIRLRDPRSRWGSCSSGGNLMFSWRLVMAPVEVLDYVAAHEVAHLAEMNHSPAFWKCVTRLCPGWEEQRRWLRANGQSLHRYRFGD